MLWACIDVPHLGIDSILRHHPTPDAPLVVVGGTAQRRHLVAVNPAAMQAGLQPGQRLAAAHALLAQFAIVQHDAAALQRLQQFLAAWAYRFSSQVWSGWPGCIALEVQGSFAIMGQWPRLQARLREDLAALGFRHRIALAPTARGARVLAGVEDGIAIQHREQLRNTLARVPVRRAHLPDDVGDRLHHMGMRRLGQVMALPRDALRRRFGAELLSHLDCLLGDTPELLDCYRPPDVFDMRVELSFEVEHHQALLFPVRRMTADLAVYLAGRDEGVQQFDLHLEHERFASTHVHVGLLSAERDPAVLFELTKARLERVAIPGPVVALRLIARHLPPFVPAGRDLFDDRPAQAVPWEQLRERLRARLGNEAVYQLASGTDPRPQHAWHRVEGEHSSQVLDRPARPTWLLKRPIPLHDPGLTVLAGPERLESGWWDGDDARRDYYILQTSKGQHAWAFTAVGEVGPWMLHGWFA